MKATSTRPTFLTLLATAFSLVLVGCGGDSANRVAVTAQLVSKNSPSVRAAAPAATCLNATTSCTTPLFVDAIAESSWFNIDVTAIQGTGGLRDALNTARDVHPNEPVRIRLAPGEYADSLGAEIFSQRLQRTSTTPIYIVATNPAPNATLLGQGINLLAVSYVAIDGVTIGPSTVGAWNGSSHSAPQPLQASAGIHVAGAALYATQNANVGGVLNTAIYGQYEPSHHVIVRNVTVQNLFELDAQSGETSSGQGMDGMKFNQVEDLWVLNNSVTQTSRHGIDNVGVHRAIFSNNIISYSGGGQGIEAKGGSVDVTVERNTFYRVRRVELGGENTDATYYFSADGRWDYEALRTVVRNNLIIDPREAGLEFSGCADCSAVGNSILFTASYQVPIDTGTVFGGDAIRVHDSMITGTSDGAGSDCQFWDGNDYVTVDPCWGVGSNAPAPIRRVLASSNVTVANNVFASVNGTFSDALGGSTIPCPLNIVDGSADLHFNGNYWWNGGNPLPTAGCTSLPEGVNSVFSTSTATTSPGFSSDVDSSSITSLASSAITGLTPRPSSSIVRAGIANASMATVDRVGNTRMDPPTIGALEPTCSIAQCPTPASGWWWNPAEGGRGFTIEQQGNKIFMGGYLYDVSGRAAWYAAGPTAMNGVTFSSTLTRYSGGQTLTGAYKSVSSTSSAGAIDIVFSDASHGTITWAGGVVPIQRFDIVAGGASATPSAGSPETGWWWNANEPGRGFSIEIQNGTMFLGGYMYDDAGDPIWYVSGPTTMTSNNTFQGTWQQYANGQTLVGSYQPASVINATVGNISVQFSSTTNGILTLPDGRQISISRYRF